MKILKTTFRNKMDVATNQISKHIFELIKNKVNNKILTQRQLTEVLNYEGFRAPVTMIVNINPSNTNNQKQLLVYCQYRSFQNFVKYLLNPRQYISEQRQIIINIIIIIPTNYSENILNELYWKLVDSIRHELQHMIDDDDLLPLRTNMNTGYNVQNVVSKNISIAFQERTKYMLSEVEKEPFIRGMVLKAKKQHIPFPEALTSFINNQYFADNPVFEKQIREVIGNENVNSAIETIKKLYLEKAALIFPNTRKML